MNLLVLLTDVLKVLVVLRPILLIELIGNKRSLMHLKLIVNNNFAVLLIDLK